MTCLVSAVHESTVACAPAGAGSWTVQLVVDGYASQGGVEMHVRLCQLGRAAEPELLGRRSVGIQRNCLRLKHLM